jgi:hypothetical protein
MQLFPWQLELPDALTSILAFKTPFRASTHWVRFPPTST